MGLSPGKLYLLAYNLLQTAGWCLVGFQTLKAVLYREDLWKAVSPTLKLFQSLAVLEVLHVVLGLVKSSPVLTACQVASRLFVLWFALEYSEQAQRNIGFPLLLFCWTLTEIVRYSYYAVGLLNIENPLLTWMRYTLFIVLYPLGVTGELLAMYSALTKVSKQQPFSSSSSVNWVWYAYVGIMLSYIPVFPKLYSHMLSQRRKVLSPQRTVSADGGRQKTT